MAHVCTSVAIDASHQFGSAISRSICSVAQSNNSLSILCPWFMPICTCAQINPSALASECARRFAASCTTNELPGKAAGEEIIIQVGPQLSSLHYCQDCTLPMCPCMRRSFLNPKWQIQDNKICVWRGRRQRCIGEAWAWHVLPIHRRLHAVISPFKSCSDSRHALSSLNRATWRKKCRHSW